MVELLKLLERWRLITTLCWGGWLPDDTCTGVVRVFALVRINTASVSISWR